MRIVIHVDLDAFFAAIEERERPEIRGKPVIVGADPKAGRGRGVVSTCNYEARKFGIRSGMPIAVAWRKCRTAVYLPVNFELYEAVSAKIMQILKRHADRFESWGIDEAYLDVSKRAGSYDRAIKIAKAIKAEIRQKEKLTCSIGIGPNKLIAKIASGFKKPDGLTVVRPSQMLEFLRPLNPLVIPGIGPKTAAVLRDLGITTIGQLRRLRKTELSEHFGKVGIWFYEAARGIDTSPVQEVWIIKSIGRQHTFERDTRDIKLLYAQIKEQAADIHSELVGQRFLYRTVTLTVRYQDFTTIQRSKSLATPTQSIELIAGVSKELLALALRDPRKIRLIGVRVSRLIGH
jgi:DNA polymerase IV (DinB-like DNA polymerase)